MNRRPLSLFAALLMLSGCSLVKLSDDIAQGSCRVDADCDVLNDEASLDEDPCQRWQCDADSKLCTYVALDRDRDGQSPASVEHGGETVMCEDDAKQRDCDDTERTVGAGFDELCDVVDNDCDGQTDEGALETKSADVVVLPSGAAAVDVGYAPDPMTQELVIGFGLRQDANLRPAVSFVEAGLDKGASITQLTWPMVSALQTEHMALAALESGRFAYALVNGAGARRLMVGTLEAGGSTLVSDSALAAAGLSCAAGEDSCPDVQKPALAVQDGFVMVAYPYFTGDVATVACATPPSPAAELRANLLLDTGSRELAERTAAAVSLGNTTDLSAAAVLAMPALGAANARDFLFAHADADGNLVVRRTLVENISATSAELTVDDEPLLQLDAGDQPRLSAALALGPERGDGVVLGVAHQRGCGVEARVVVGLYQLSRSGEALSVEAIVEELEVGGAIAQAAPALAYSAKSDTWAVAYRDRDGLRARVLAADGTLHADEPYLLVDATEDGTDVLLTPAVQTLADGFGMVAHVARGDAEPRVFESVRLSCD